MERRDLLLRIPARGYHEHEPRRLSVLEHRPCRDRRRREQRRDRRRRVRKRRVQYHDLSRFLRHPRPDQRRRTQQERKARELFKLRAEGGYRSARRRHLVRRSPGRRFVRRPERDVHGVARRRRRLRAVHERGGVHVSRGHGKDHQESRGLFLRIRDRGGDRKRREAV